MARSFSAVFAFAVVACLLGGCSGGGGDGDGGNNGVIAFGGFSYSVSEDVTSIVILVTRTGGTGDVSVTVTLTDGTATAPDDYDSVPVPVVLEWLGGDTTDKVFTVTIVDDTNDEPEETLDMTLGSPTGGAVIGNPGSVPLIIFDEDVAGTVQFDSSAYTYAEDETTLMPVNITRTGGMDGAISVTIVSTDGTANSDPLSQVEPVDYSPLMGFVVSFADQSTTPSAMPVALNIAQDPLPELDETFTLSLTSPTNGAVIGSPSSATVTITDDDDMWEIPGIQLNEFFGSVVAKLGPKLVIGAPGLDNGAGGFATVGLDGPAIEETYFPAPPFGSGVGRALSVDGLNVLVGGLSNVYHYHDPVLGNASPTHSILNALDGFGFSVHLTSSRIIVGAPNANGGAGAVIVYDSAGSFLQQVDGRAGELFGTSLAPAGSNFGVGAPGNEGSVQFFGVGNGTLNLILDNPFPGGGPGGPAYGEAVAVSEANFLIFVGAPNEDTLAMNDGRVYRYDGLTINSWLPPGAPTANGRFGANVLVTSTGVVLVQQQGAGAMATGQVHAFDLAGNFLQTFVSPVAAPLGDFGASMCEFDGAVAIGAPKVPALIQQGRVFMFRLPVVP